MNRELWDGTRSCFAHCTFNPVERLCLHRNINLQQEPNGLTFELNS